MDLVLDASVSLAWAFEDEGGPYARGVLEALAEREAVTTTLWPLEVANGLLVAERKGRIEGPDATRFMQLLLALPVVIDPLDRRRVFETAHPLARRRDLSAYDALYLELAARLGIPLATLDGRLAQAAADEGVGLLSLPPERPGRPPGPERLTPLRPRPGRTETGFPRKDR